MEETEGGGSGWADGPEYELVRELLDDESPLFLLPEETTIESKPSPANDQQAINQLISTVYSGPTIRDIENALSTTGQKDQFQSVSQARISLWERGLSKIENNKYTLKLKTCGNGMADDGYKWRKYGQKSIKNSPYPRSYYRCTNPRCSAKKQVERSGEDEDTLIITYEGLHLHFAYPYLLFNQPNHPNQPSKKPKRAALETEAQAHEAQETPEEAQECPLNYNTNHLTNMFDDCMQESGLEGVGSQGLLEDVVPFLIRNPSNTTLSSNSSSCSSYRSAPASPSSLSWSPNHPHSCFDISINTSIR